MFCWCITKYDPKNRDKNRVYLKGEWTEYGDIGKIFEGKELTYEEYVKVEWAYIQAVLFFMDCLDINSLKIISLEQVGKKVQDIDVDGNVIKNNVFYEKEMVVFIIRSILRYRFWCMLEAEGMRVRFDFDYYMTLGCIMPSADTIKKIERLGLFVEKSGLEFLFDELDDN